MLAYGHDRESTAYSRSALESLLKAISRDPAVGEISVLAHSMGNSLALETLRQMAIRDGKVTPKIRAGPVRFRCGSPLRHCWSRGRTRTAVTGLMGRPELVDDLVIE
jgi:hypothetical protein